MDSLLQWCKPLLLGDLYVNLADQQGDQACAVAADLATYDFEDLLLQFRQHRGYRHRHTWKQHHDGTKVCSHCDYILGLDWHMLLNVCLKDPRLFTSDHLLVLGVLPASPTCDHGWYLQSRQLPSWGLTTQALIT
jgi:hypothetical protein